jgi:two-component system, NtrC family, response regulator HydG
MTAVRLAIAAGDAPLVVDLDPQRATTVGRHRSNAVVLSDRRASRRHAEVYCEAGRWFIRDCNTINGTHVDGTRIEEPAPLAPGTEIRIGGTRLCFLGDPSELDTDEQPLNGKPADAGESGLTTLQADELTVLCEFMTTSLDQDAPRDLVARALSLVHSHTRASLTGFLSLDEESPLPHQVIPANARPDAQFSRALTRLAQKELRSVWLGADSGPEIETESVAAYTDALCVPLRVGERALGALHVYRKRRRFSAREVQFCEVLAGYLARCLHGLRCRRKLVAENRRLRRPGRAPDEKLVGSSPAMEHLRRQIDKLGPSPCGVVITGASGVGKELVALALHQQSPRGDGPLVAVNCGAIPATLLEAELFGHCRGAFTTAVADRRGYFEQADEGTLFLDEIGDLSPDCQVKLLRVIEGKGFRRVGGSEEIFPDVRILAATHRDLGQMVREGKFRQDLYFRLGVGLRVPPLCEHPEDIPDLVSHFLTGFARSYQRPLRVTAAALARLQAYSWPGNVRQLRAVLENAIALGDGATIDAEDLCLPDEPAVVTEPPSDLNLQHHEVGLIREALRRADGVVIEAARLLGIHRDTLSAKMKKAGIPREGA